MAGSNYRYELRRGDDIIATGHISWEDDLNVGDEITIGRHRAFVDTIEPVLRTNEKRLVVRVRDASSKS
jgi:hypothetical protein